MPRPADEARRINVVVALLLAGGMEDAVRQGLSEGFSVSQQGPRDVTFDRPTSSVSTTGSLTSSPGSVTASLRHRGATATIIATPTSKAFMGDARLVRILRRAVSPDAPVLTTHHSWFARMLRW